MLSLLEYVKNLRITPKGNRITPNQKLALIFFIMEGNGGETVFNPALICEYCILGHPKSASRLIGQLKEEGLLTVIPQRNEKGHPLDSLVYPLPDVPRESAPSNLQVTGQANPSNLQVPSMPPGNLQVPSNAPSNLQVTGRKYNGDNELRENPSGTKIALIPPSPVLNKEGGIQENPSNLDVTGHPALTVWFELTQEEEINEKGARMIIESVFNIPVWRTTLNGWIASGWNVKNIDGQISRYKKKIREEGLSNSPSLLTAPPRSPQNKQEETEEQRKLKEIIYNED